MPSDLPRLPQETYQRLLNRGAAYAPLLAYEVHAMPTRKMNLITGVLMPAVVIALAVLTVVLWAKLLTGG